MRFKWLSADWPVSMRTLASRMQNHGFSEGAKSGYLLERVRQDLVEGRFIERCEISETVGNPLGGASTYDRVEFKETRFTASSSKLGIEIVNPPRGLNSFVGAISDICDYQVAISEIKVDLMQWSSLLEVVSGKSFQMRKATVAGVHLGEGVYVSATVRGPNDIRSQTSDFLGKMLDYRKIELKSKEPEPTAVVLSSKASAALSGPSRVLYLDALRKALESLQES